MRKTQSAMAQLEVNPAKAKTWFVGVTIYCAFLNNNSPPPRLFLCNKILLKKLPSVRGMPIEQIFELRGPLGPLAIYEYMYIYNWLFL